MLVTFTTKAYSDITMFGDAALAMLKMMGRSGTVLSAIRAEDVPAALNRLTAAVNAATSPPPSAGKEADGQVVSAAHRALPLINPTRSGNGVGTKNVPTLHLSILNIIVI